MTPRLDQDKPRGGRRGGGRVEKVGKKVVYPFGPANTQKKKKVGGRHKGKERRKRKKSKKRGKRTQFLKSLSHRAIFVCFRPQPPSKAVLWPKYKVEI